MFSNPFLSRPFNWPSPYSLSGRVLAWAGYFARAIVSLLCLLFALAVLAVGILAAVGLLALAVPVVAIFAIGWLLRGLARELIREC